ncbi:MAG TPA: hypothetical protein VMW35_22875 [Myxococcota bacterium]|jgi:hypothetical protein|nr:hypothetical protein [Myxococcota bacterium]
MGSFERYRLVRAAFAASLVLTVSAPALAATLWKYQASNGVWAYVDDEKKIPERYKGAAVQVGDTNLADYPRYTPADGAATKAYSEALAKRIEMLRAIAEEPPSRGQIRVYPAGGGPARTVVRQSSEFGTSVETLVGTGYDEAEPIVTEQVRLYVPDRIVTRTNTIVRRGGEVISIQRPLPAQNPLPDLYDVESDGTRYPYYDRVGDDD